jgi:hypothetical protein
MATLTGVSEGVAVGIILGVAAAAGGQERDSRLQRSSVTGVTIERFVRTV